MQITYLDQTPPGLPPHSLEHEVAGERITFTHRTYHRDGTVKREVVDSFDFSDLPDGRMDRGATRTSLPVMPIRSAERIEGLLHVTLLHWTGED